MPEFIASNGSRFQLRGDAGLIGRRDPDGRMPDPDVDLGGVDGGHSVSRRHVALYRTGQTWYLKVLESARNPTLVAGRRLETLQEAALHDGDEIMLGTVSLVFRDGGAPPPPPPPQPVAADMTVDRSAAVDDANRTLFRPRLSSAEIRSGKISVQLADNRLLTLGRESDDHKYRPDVDLREVPRGKTISRKHGLLINRGGTWYLRVEADSTNTTFLNATPLQKGQEVALTDGDQLRMGEAVATFHQEKTPRFVDADKLDLTLGPPTDLTVEPGSQQSTSLTLVNFTGLVQWFILEVSGVPTEWWKIVVPDGRSTPDGRPSVRLDTAVAPVPTPTATAKATVTLAPPRRSDAPAGTYPLLLIATSQDNQRLRRTATGQLVVLPFVTLRLAVDQMQLRGSSGRYRLTVGNDGNAPTTVSLGVEADAKKVEPKLQHPEITLDNGGEQVVDLNLRVKRKLWQGWLGPEVVHKARVTAVGGQQTQAQDLLLTCPPRIPLWLQKIFDRTQSALAPIVLMCALLAVVVVAGFFWLLPPDVKLVPAKPLIASGATTTLSWHADRGRGEAILETTAGTQQVNLPDGKISVSPTQTFEYKLTAKNLIGLSTTATTRVQVLRVVTFTAATEALKQPGDPVTLQWTTENATTVSIDPPDEITAFPVNGQAIVHPRTSTTYHLVATNDQYQAKSAADARASFPGAKIGQFQQDRQEVYPGDPVLLSWMADGFAKLTLKGTAGDLELNGVEQDVTRRASIQVRPVRSGDYVLVAANADGTTAEAQISIRVLSIKAPRLEGPVRPISAGEIATLKWQLDGANDLTKVVLQPDGIDVSKKASIEVRPTHTTEYTLVVTGAQRR